VHYADMERETITEMVARMQNANLEVGARIRVIGTGRTGTIEARGHKHNGWKVRWDDVMFGVESGWVRSVHMERIEVQ
jgi:deoxycytidylate deaminase